VDIYIIHMDSEWQIAQIIAGFMHEQGYIVAPTHTLALPARSGPDPMPADANAVLVIWPIRSELFPKPALEARAASQRGHLLQIYAGQARPEDTYAGPPPINFATWDYQAAGPQWAQLMHGLRKLCGPPPRPKVDVSAATQTAVMVGTLFMAIIGAIFALGQSSQQPTLQAGPASPIDGAQSAPAEVATDADARPIREVARDIGADDTLSGGPTNEDYEKDRGVEMGKTPPAALPEEEAAPARRPVQGPEL
jgi:hypothetical protein